LVVDGPGEEVAILRSLTPWLPCALLLGLAGCGGGDAGAPVHAPDPRSGGIERCDRYEGRPALLEYCLFSVSETLTDPGEASELCGRAGGWEASCRQSWVSRHMTGPRAPSVDELLSVCGDFEDCRFQVIDGRPLPALADQVERCREWAPTFDHDCVGHALERAYQGGLDEEALRAMVSLNTGLPQRETYFVAASVGCRGVGSCDLVPGDRVECERQAESFRTGRISCPVHARPPTE